MGKYETNIMVQFNFFKSWTSIFWNLPSSECQLLLYAVCLYAFNNEKIFSYDELEHYSSQFLESITFIYEEIDKQRKKWNKYIGDLKKND